MTDVAPTDAARQRWPSSPRGWRDELARLDAELGEIDLLVTQATTEADAARGPRVSPRPRSSPPPRGRRRPPEPIDPASPPSSTPSWCTLTKRAALMEAQVDVLEGKRRALGRYRDALAGYVEALGAFGDVPARERRRPAGGAAADAGAASRRPSRGSSSTPRRTSAARSPGRCTTDRPRA